MQGNFGLPDRNAELLDFNRHKLESLPQYIKRVWTNHQMSQTNCLGMDEMIPCKYRDLNAKMKTFGSTYYFAHATGERKIQRDKPRELLAEPSKMMNRSYGFDPEVRQNLTFRNTVKRLRRRDAKVVTTTKEQAQVCFKLCTNLLSLIEKTLFDNFHHINWGMDYLDNRLNPKMNNIMAIDHATRDWIDDTDYLLARKTTQYPCVSSKYTQKNEQKPWGDQRDPIFIEPFLDEN